jgi:hypothetical protein
MKEFLLLFRGGLGFHTATEDQIQKAMKKWETWMGELTRQGKLSGGKRLTPEGTVLKGHEKQVIDGPFTEGKEIVGGYLMIKADDFKEAVEIAKGCPIFDYDGITEVRELVAG